MRIRIEGVLTAGRLHEVVMDLLARASQGAVVTDVNLYVTLRNRQGHVIEFTDEDGEPLSMLTYREQREYIPLRQGRPPRVKKGQKPALKIVGGTEAQAA